MTLTWTRTGRFANRSLKLLLAAVALIVPAHGAKSKVKVAQRPLIAPAIVHDEGENLRRALLARLEFEELNLSLVGIAAFQGKTACYIKHPGATEQMIYNIGDVIGGYRIAAIDNQSVTFERDGTQFFLMIGESSGNSQLESAGDEFGSDKAPAPMAEKPPVISGPAVLSGSPVAAPTALPNTSVAAAGKPADHTDDLVIKLASADIKKKTKKFQTARLIENGFRSSTGSRRNGANVVLTGGGKFVVPIGRGELSSKYGYRRDPFGGERRFHRGIDIAAPYNTDILAACDGIVTKARTSYSYGRYVVIRHSNGYETLYGHLSRQLVSEGEFVKQGQRIGKEGSTGSSTGPHLHFEIHRNGWAVDPENYIHPRQ